MINKRFLSIGILAVAALGLGACVDQYAYGRAPGYYDDVGYYSQYDRFYGDPYGFRNVPVGFLGAGFGWYDNFYYPGVGSYVYDRRGFRRGWNQQQRAYWQPRVEQRQHYRRDNSVISNRIGRGIAQQQFDRRGNRIEKGQVRTDRQGNRIERRENQIDRQQLSVDRQGNQIDRRQLRADRQGNRVDRQRTETQVQRPAQQGQVQRPVPQVQAQRQARVERQVQQRPQRELRQQYQRQQQSYGNGGRERRQPR